MPSCQLGTSLILATLPGWHAAPTPVPRPALITAFLRFRSPLFCHFRFEWGFYLQVMMKGAAEFLWFPCESTPSWGNATRCILTPPDARAGVITHSSQCRVAPLFRQIHLWLYHNLSVPTGGGGCLSWYDYSLSISSDKWDRCSGCCGGSASVTLHTLPEPQTKLPNPSRSAVTHWHGVPLGGCAFAAAMYCRFGAAIFKASIIASYSIRSLSAAASDFPTICWMMRSRRFAPEEWWNPIFAALRRFSPTTRHCSLSLTRHRNC